jgi:hypothetical protein
MEACPFLQQQQQQQESNQCIVTEAYKLLESALAVLEPEMATRDEKLILNTDAFLGLETVRGRTYRFMFESHQKDSSGSVVLSENYNDQLADRVMNGGKARIKISLVYYDSCEEEVDDSQLHPLFSMEATIHDTKAAGNILILGEQLKEGLNTNNLLPGESTPIRCVINKHIKYTIDEEGQSNSHYTVFKNRFCHWKSFKVTTAASLDDTHNFVYGGECNTEMILYHKQTKQNKSIVPDSWVTTPTFQLAQIFLKTAA